MFLRFSFLWFFSYVCMLEIKLFHPSYERIGRSRWVTTEGRQEVTHKYSYEFWVHVHLSS